MSGKNEKKSNESIQSMLPFFLRGGRFFFAKFIFEIMIFKTLRTNFGFYFFPPPLVQNGNIFEYFEYFEYFLNTFFCYFYSS